MVLWVQSGEAEGVGRGAESGFSPIISTRDRPAARVPRSYWSRELLVLQDTGYDLSLPGTHPMIASGGPECGPHTATIWLQTIPYRQGGERCRGRR